MDGLLSRWKEIKSNSRNNSVDDMKLSSFTDNQSLLKT